MLTVIFAILVLAAIAIFLFAYRGIPQNVSDLTWPIKGLLEQGFDGGFLVFKIGFFKSEFIQFRKYIMKSGIFGLNFTLPRAKWSNILFPRVEEHCKSNNIKYSIEKYYLDGELDFLVVDFKKDWIGASKFCENLLVDVLNLNPDSKVYFTLNNASPTAINEV